MTKYKRKKHKNKFKSSQKAQIKKKIYLLHQIYSLPAKTGNKIFSDPLTQKRTQLIISQESARCLHIRQ